MDYRNKRLTDSIEGRDSNPDPHTEPAAVGRDANPDSQRHECHSPLRARRLPPAYPERSCVPIITKKSSLVSETACCTVRLVQDRGRIMNTIVKEIEEMPAEIQREALDFAFFLMTKRSAHSIAGTVKQRWSGALREFRSQFTSLELQKRDQDWRAQDHVST